MKMLISGSSLALALLLAGCGGDDAGNTATASVNSAAPIPQIAAPEGTDWTQTIAATPEGGFRMGNPDAPLKLIEFASMTCPHCAAFSEAGSEPLRERYIRSGQVSFEFRNFVLNPIDAAATVLTRCRGPNAFFQITEQLFADQANWGGRIDETVAAQLQSVPADQQLAAVVRAAGLDSFFRTRGMPEAQLNACLADQQGMQKLVEMRDAATREYQVPGTPAFVLNGELLQNVTTWEALEAALRERIG